MKPAVPTAQILFEYCMSRLWDFSLARPQLRPIDASIVSSHYPD